MVGMPWKSCFSRGADPCINNAEYAHDASVYADYASDCAQFAYYGSDDAYY